MSTIPKPEKIAVVGGGIMGLSAAYYLKKEGVDVDIFEGAAQIGGLVSGFELEGASLEKTYHHIFKTDKSIIELFEELKIDDKLNWYDSSVGIIYSGSVYSLSSPVDLLKFKPLSFLGRVRLGIIFVLLKYIKNWRLFVNITAFSWTRRYSGSEVFKIIWEPLLRGKFHRYSDKVSMAWLWARIHVRLNSRKTSTVEQLGYPMEGFEVLIKAMKKYLKNNDVNINTNSLLTSIKNGKSDTVEIETIKKRKYKYDKVLFTGPSYVFAKLLDGNKYSDSQRAYIKRLKSVEYIGAICVVFTMDQKIGEKYWYNMHDSDAPFLVFINHTNLVGKDSYNGRNVYYMGTYLPHDSEVFAMREEEIYDKWFEYLGRVFREFDLDSVKSKFLFKMKNAQHIVDLGYEDKMVDKKTPFSGVYFCNFSQIFPEDRGLNYSVREGRALAEEVILDLKKDKKSV